MYIPNRPSPDCKAPRRKDAAAIEVELHAHVDKCAIEDTQGAAALASVLLICNDKPLSSCRCKILKALGAGWAAEAVHVVRLVSPTGQRIGIPNGLLNAASVAKANPCWTVGANERAEKLAHTRSKINEIAWIINEAVLAQTRLDELLGNVAHIEYLPWRIMDDMLAQSP